MSAEPLELRQPDVGNVGKLLKSAESAALNRRHLAFWRISGAAQSALLMKKGRQLLSKRLATFVFEGQLPVKWLAPGCRLNSRNIKFFLDCDFAKLSQGA